MGQQAKLSNDKQSAWDRLLATAPELSVENCPRITTIIPTYKCPHSIVFTLDSLLQQDYPDFEILVIDASSPDRTTDVIHSYHDERIRIYTVTEYHSYEMINRGISLSTGRYINVLFPGDFYLSAQTLQFVAELAIDHRSPDLIYSASMLHDVEAETRLLYRPLSLEHIQSGQQPTSLQACWWRFDTLMELGKFNKHLEIRGGYDLMSRFIRKSGLRSTSTHRVLTDYTHRTLSHHSILLHFRETAKIIWRDYGLWTTLRWFLAQRDLLRSLRLWSRRMRIAFLGR